MTRSWEVELSAVIGDNRWSPQRIAEFDENELDRYARILQRFAEGRPAEAAKPKDSVPDEALGRLVARDLVQLDAAGNVAVAYPFSAHPTRHRVRLGNGRCHWACCAIDALGIPYLLRERAVIDAREPDGGRPIMVVVDPDAGTLPCDPPGATVVVAASGDGCTAACACPHINLLGSRRAAERYLSGPGVRGTIIGVADAAAAGAALFADLGHLLTVPRGRRGAAREAGGVTIELLFFHGCPGHERLVPGLRELAEQRGTELVLRAVETPADAEREQFLGSPTVRVNGRDVDPGAGARTDFGLKCRLYRSAEGGQSAVPPESWIRAALDAARNQSRRVAAAEG